MQDQDLERRLAEVRNWWHGAPLASTLSATLEKLDGGYAVVSASPGNALTIPGGVTVQGGIIVAIADFAGVLAAMTKVPAGHTPLVSIEEDFFLPVACGEAVRAVARIVDDIRSSLWADVEIFAVDGAKKGHGRLRYAKPKLSC